MDDRGFHPGFPFFAFACHSAYIQLPWLGRQSHPKLIKDEDHVPKLLDPDYLHQMVAQFPELAGDLSCRRHKMGHWRAVTVNGNPGKFGSELWGVLLGEL